MALLIVLHDVNVCVPAVAEGCGGRLLKADNATDMAVKVTVNLGYSGSAMTMHEITDALAVSFEV